MLNIRDFRQCGLLLLISFTTLMVVLSPLAIAQTVLEEIIVTAEKREMSFRIPHSL